jgi:hypothetical protein
MNATCAKPNLLNRFFLKIFFLPLGATVLLLAATGVFASLVMILTPIGMLLAPTWSVQLFYWKFETALDAWYLPVFGILLDLCLFHLVKSIVQFVRQVMN